MKNIKIYMAIVILLGYSISVSAQTLKRVGFTASSVRLPNIDFPTLQAAHDAASSGDTIQIYPGTQTSLPNYFATFTKKIVLIGSGYLYNTYNTATNEISNTGLQSLSGGISGTTITLSSGSSGTSFYGIKSLYVSVNNNISDSINNIIVSRSNATIDVGSNSNVLNNWLITQCYGVSINQTPPTNTSFSGNRSLTNWRFENCIFPDNSGHINLFQSPVGISSLLFLNCNFNDISIFIANQSVVFQNNIIELKYANLNGTANTIFINNITNKPKLNNPIFTNPGSANNVFDVNIGGTGNVVFLGYPNNTSGTTVLNSPDARFKLSTAGVNPAKNAGIIPGTTTATDCGAYGGTNPYRESGIPAVPAFYRFNSPSPTATGTSYPVTFSVRSNN
ncbi:MAG TPA: hypothetical protein PLK14_05535 [Sediminibacterium sp.]|nr:hypothetical protein [Sediminibacterium sp.]